MRKLLWAWFFFLIPALAWAQCAGQGGVPFSCVPGGPIGVSDQFLGGQNSNTVSFTADQVATMVTAAGKPASFSTLIVTSGGTLGGTFAGNPTFSGNVTFSGSTIFSGGLALSSINLSNSTIQLKNSTISSLPPVTPANAGQIAFATDCPNGSQSVGAGSGCIYVVSSTGAWVGIPSPSNLTITIGGQSIYLGGSPAAVQGNGGKIQLATGTFVTGHALAYDVNGNAVDSGVTPGGGGGGSGTVNNCGTGNALSYYASSGTAVSCLAVVNSAVLSTNSSGVPALSTTLPSALTIPSPTITGATLTGTSTIDAITGTNKWTLSASTAARASLNIPNGTAPTSPVAGDIWGASNIVLYRSGTSTVGFATTINGGPLTASSPLAVSASGAFTCTLCATTSGGGTLSATAPIVLTGNAYSLGSTTAPIVWLADSVTGVHADTYYLPVFWPWTSGVIQSFKFFTGGSSTPSFVASLQIAGANVTGCNAITVSASNTPASPGTATCTAANTINSGQALTLVITSVVGTPASAGISITYTHSNP